jgi:hypothetical protein
VVQSRQSFELFEHLKFSEVGNYQTYKHRFIFMLMWKNSWWFVDHAIRNPFVSKEPKDIVQGWIIGLTIVRLNVCLEVYVWIIDCIDPCVAWVRFRTQYQFVNNVARLMFKDKLNNFATTWRRICYCISNISKRLNLSSKA